MRTYTDLEVKAFIEQQEKNFRLTARGSGFEALEAKRTLVRLSGLSMEHKMDLGRMNLERLQKQQTA